MRFPLVLPLLLLSVAAHAANWKMIEGNGSAYSSQCLGSNQTIECFVDTIMACEVWSLSYEYAESGHFTRADICLSPGAYGGSDITTGFLPDPVDPRLVRFLYYWEAWTLTEADIAAFRYAPQKPGKVRSWQPGDTVVDLYLNMCSPELTCLAALPSGTPWQEAAGLCPQTDCWGAPFDIETEYCPREEGGGRMPSISLFLRQEAEGWFLATLYPDGHYLDPPPYWCPDHWKVK